MAAKRTNGKITEEQLRRAQVLRTAIAMRDPSMCCWHQVLVDGDVTNVVVGGCRTTAEMTLCVELAGDVSVAVPHEDCVRIGGLIASMSESQRRKFAKNGYAALVAETDVRPITRMSPLALRLARDSWRREMLDDVCVFLETSPEPALPSPLSRRQVAATLRERFADFADGAESAGHNLPLPPKHLAKCKPKDKRTRP